MKNAVFRYVLLIATSWMLAGVSFAERYAPTVGQVHQDFRLPRIDNRKPVSLSDYRGKRVLLIQFASW